MNPELDEAGKVSERCSAQSSERRFEVHSKGSPIEHVGGCPIGSNQGTPRFRPGSFGGVMLRNGFVDSPKNLWPDTPRVEMGVEQFVVFFN